MTCWAPVRVLISICDCSQFQGGRHSGILVLAARGCFICGSAFPSPCARCLWLPAPAWPLSAAPRGVLLLEPLGARRVPAEHPPGRAGTLPSRERCKPVMHPFGNGEVCSFSSWNFPHLVFRPQSFLCFPPGFALLGAFWFGFALLCSSLASVPFLPPTLLFFLPWAA